MIIIIGLPGSGKSYYYENNIKKMGYELYDDFISEFFNGELYNNLKNNLCLIDPRLCNFELFVKIMKIIQEKINKSNIKLILFTNDKELSFNYSIDKYCPPGEHILKIVVKDLVGNTTVKEYHFTR